MTLCKKSRSTSSSSPLPEKSCVFLSFLNSSTAAVFHADATIKKLSLHGQELKISWGKLSPVPSQVALIDQVKIFCDKNIGFIHFLSISIVTKAICFLATQVLFNSNIFLGHEHVAHRTYMGWEVCQLWQGPLCAYSEVSASGSTGSPAQMSPRLPQRPLH